MASKSSAVHGAGVVLMAWAACLLGGCPSTVRCGAGETFDGTRCVPFDGDGGMTDAPSDATEGDTPCGGCTAPQVCDTASGDCVACNDAEDCMVGSRGAACVDHACVACADNADCESLTAPQCNTTSHMCEPCTTPAACTGRTGTEVCSDAGACVECGAGAEEACDAGVCDVSLGECTTIAEGSAVACEPCINDRQCDEGQVCAPTTFPVLGGTEVGYRCLWRQDAPEGPDGNCNATAVRPYVRALSVTTRNGAEVDVCAPRVSTCDALADFQSSTITCTEALPTPDDLCGAESFDDGFCRSGQCTVGCTTNDDCPCTDGTCARQYRCRMGFCESACECPTSGGACVGTCP